MYDPDAEAGASAASFYELTNRLERLYVSYYDRYVMAVGGAIFIPKTKPTPENDGEAKPRRLDNRVMVAHMKRRLAIGVFAGEKSSKFICFDVDLPDPGAVHAIMDALVKVGFPKESLYVSSSGGKGYHVEMFFNEPMYTNTLRDLYELLLSEAKLDKHKVEFRPTYGQSIKLPLSKHPKTGNVCCFLDPDTLEPINDLWYFLGIEQLDRDWATQLIRSKAPFTLHEEVSVERTGIPAKEFETVHFDTEFPDITAPGMRNHLMVSIAVHERYAGKSEEEIRDELSEWVARQAPSLISDPQEEVERDLQNIPAWVCSDGFNMSAEREIKVTAGEMRFIAAQQGIRKKILLLLLLFFKRYGRAKISIHRIAEYVGASYSAVHMNLNKMAEAKLITVRRGKAKKVGEKMVGVPSTYVVHIPPHEAGERSPLVVAWDFKADGFDAVWNGCVSALLTTEEQKRYLTKKGENKK